MQLSAIEADLDDVYEMFTEQAIDLVKANQEIEVLKLRWLRKTGKCRHSPTLRGRRFQKR